MSYRSKRKYLNTIPEPNSNDWLPIRGSQLWLSTKKNLPVTKHPLFFDIDLDVTSPGWVISRSALSFLLKSLFGNDTKFEIDWIKKVGEGLSKEVYRADVTLIQEKERHIVFAVSLLLGDADEEAGSRMIEEFCLLDLINSSGFSFSIPEPIGIIWNNGTLVSIRTFVFGIPIELRVSKSYHERPWEIIAKVAAEIHKIQIEGQSLKRKYYSRRHDHALSLIEKYKNFELPEIKEALTWVKENLPSNEKSSLLHSDLLGQNIYRTEDDGLYVLDWEYSFFGDPAYDLAIVTRGVKRPFQVTGGLDYLIDSYLAAGGKAITKKTVYIYEIFLILGWYKQSIVRSTGGHSPEYYLQQLQRLLKRVDY